MQVEEDLIADIYPVTPLQAGMIASTIKDRTAYINHLKFNYSDELSIRNVSSAVAKMMNAHAVFRTKIVSTTKGLFQVVRKELVPPVYTKDSFLGFMAKDLEKGFGLEEDVWFRVTVVPDENAFILTIHHILYDGWCIPTIVSSLTDAYDGKDLVSGTPFKAVVEFVEQTSVAQAHEFWNNYLKGVEPKANLKLLTDAVETDLSKPVSGQILHTTCDLNVASSTSGYTLATILKAAWAIVLHKYTGDHDVLFGSIVSGRDIPVRGIQRYNVLI